MQSNLSETSLLSKGVSTEEMTEAAEERTQERLAKRFAKRARMCRLEEQYADSQEFSQQRMIDEDESMKKELSQMKVSFAVNTELRLKLESSPNCLLLCRTVLYGIEVRHLEALSHQIRILGRLF